MKQKNDTAESLSKKLTLRWCLLVYLCLTGVNLVVHNRLIDSQAPFLEKRQELHGQVLANKAPAPIQYRIFAYYAAEGLQKLGISFQASYLIFRGISIFLAAWMFHVFLAMYFPSMVCFTGVLVLLACMPMTYINYYMQESDALNLFFYITSFILIRSRKDLYLFPLLIIAMLNRETPVLIPLIWALYRWDELKVSALIIRFFGLLSAALGTYLGLRIVFGHHEAYSDFFYLKFNLTQVNTYLYFFLFFLPFLLLIIKEKSFKPKFIYRTLLFVPFFLAFHLAVPIFQEARLILPLFPIIIPAGLCYFYRPEADDSFPGFEPAAWLKKSSKLLYIFFFIIFIAQIQVFYKYVENTHVSAWREKASSEKFLRMGTDYMLRQDYKRALTAFGEGLKKSPVNFDLHFNIASIYTDMIKDRQKAIYHWNKCLQIDRSSPRIREVLDNLDKARNLK